MTDEEKALEELCASCSKVAGELFELARLRVKGKARPWQSLWQAVRAVWSKDEIESLLPRMSFLKEVELHVLVDL